MPTDWLPAISTGEQCTCSWIALDLICLGNISTQMLSNSRRTTHHKYTDVEFLSNVFDSIEELSQLCLTLTELRTTNIVHTEASHDAVNDEQAKLPRHELFAERFQELKLLLAIVAARIRDILQRCIPVNSKPLGDLDDSLGTECPFGVNVRGFSFSAAHVFWELSNHTHGVAELCFAAAVFAIHFTDTLAFEATAKDLIELLAACRYLDDPLAFVKDLDAGDERSGIWLVDRHESIMALTLAARRVTDQAFFDSFLNPVYFGVTEAFDLLKMFLHRPMN